MTDIPSHLDFLRDRFGGKNWVVARRTPSITARYGDDVICVSSARYAAVRREYRKLYGDPDDKVRAEMYRTLLACKTQLSSSADSDSVALSVRIDAAIAAEAA